MDLTIARHRLQLPHELRGQLIDFRRHLWAIKLTESVCGAIFGVLVAFLATFMLDRIIDTPAALRMGILIFAVLGCGVVPVAFHRWIWRHRRLEQLARLLSRKLPRIGDQLLGIIELAESESEQARSRTLCEAAIEHVAKQASTCNFRTAVPAPRHRRWAVMAVAATAATVLLGVVYPAAALNAWSRFLAPWQATPRYTFAMIDPLPEQLIVPHGEPFIVTVRLTDNTVSRPARGQIQIGNQPPVFVGITKDEYRFEMPAQLESQPLKVRIGDASSLTRLEPTLRPELTSINAAFILPEYLGRSQPQSKDVRGGAISMVKGSRATFTATASRALSAAHVDGKPRSPAGADFSSPESKVDDSYHVEFQWRDKFGLAGKEPFTLSITGRDDEAPALACEDLPRQKVVLDSELLSFQVRAQDDFGIKAVGFEWQGIDDKVVEKSAKGERMLGAGAHDKDTMELAGTFSAQNLGIEPQPIQLRLFVEDYLPGRPRVYSPTYTLYVLNAEQHAIWMTEQLNKWHRQSLEVRDREMQLHETNKQLRSLAADQLDQPETRRQIEKQAGAERANGRRLSGLVTTGEELVKQASRNPEFGVGHLEKWAEMLQILKDISGNRMPSVADLLNQAAQAPQMASNPSPSANPSPNAKPPRMAGNVRTAGGSGSTKKDDDDKKPKPANEVPVIADVESSQQPKKKNDDEEAPDTKKSGQPSLRLPVTMLAGGKSDPNSCPTEQKLEEAIVKQQDLLAEFDKIADELNRVLAALEGSTLVKRLKAESRAQTRVANRVGDQVSDSFGGLAAAGGKPFEELSEQERKSSQVVSFIMDDMQGYFERRRFVQFKTVLEDMRKQDILGSLRQLADDIPKENGVAIALCEYWSDTLDRWAEDLVEPASGGT